MTIKKRNSCEKKHRCVNLFIYKKNWISSFEYGLKIFFLFRNFMLINKRNIVGNYERANQPKAGEP